ncbi:MAG: Fic family protein [Firmicutes bacterium]|nr:Fic family protein [Bacillota bacterium]
MKSERSDLIKFFYDKYMTKEEIMYRLPLELNIDDFWTEELEYRRSGARVLPLHFYDGKAYMYNRTAEFIRSADVITSMARNTSDTSVFADLGDGSLIDEAYYSSIIEGAFSTREKAHALVESGREPSDKDERMILNNYNALRFVLDNLDYPVTENLIIRIGQILTEGTDESIQGYRDDNVYVMSHTGKVIYTAPDPQYIKDMMSELVDYINDPEIHPVERAVIAHVFFVTIHPFFDGNGRTARALTYMILLKAGYDFFKYVPISGILSEERGRYYKAIRASQNEANGYDLTYFTNYYSSLLAKTVRSVGSRLKVMDRLSKLKALLDPEKDVRLIKGAVWLATEDVAVITAEKWRNKFGVSFETARKDLMKLTELGFLKRRVDGHKVSYSIDM